LTSLGPGSCRCWGCQYWRRCAPDDCTQTARVISSTEMLARLSYFHEPLSHKSHTIKLHLAAAT